MERETGQAIIVGLIVFGWAILAVLLCRGWWKGGPTE